MCYPGGLSYWVVEASSPDALCFLAFWSVPPKYLWPVKQAASCFALMAYLACISRCVIPFPNLHSILYASVAANNWVGLLSFSFCKCFDCGFGVMVSCTLASTSSGSSAFLGIFTLSMRPSRAFTWMRGWVTTFRVAMSCGAVRDRDRWASTLQALEVCLWATSRSSKSSLSKSLVFIQGCFTLDGHHHLVSSWHIFQGNHYF